MICGTIPVVEEPCATYEGYRYHLMSAAVEREDAEHNFALAWERMTLDPEQLRAEILDQLRSPDAVLEGERKDYAGGVFAT